MDAVILSKLSTGNSFFDQFLNGGYEKDIITTFYGPSGSGKTTFALLATVSVLKQGKKVIYVDTESSFSVERFKQIIGDDFEEYLTKQFYFLKPVNFTEQQTAFEKLKELITPEIGLIIIDSISMLYRLEIGKTKDVYEVNKKLGMQLSCLSEITRKNQIPVVVTNQVYSNFDDRNKVNLVGGDILRYSSKMLIELQNPQEGPRKLILRKSRALSEGKTFQYNFSDAGIEIKKEEEKK